MTLANLIPSAQDIQEQLQIDPLPGVQEGTWATPALAQWEMRLENLGHNLPLSWHWNVECPLQLPPLLLRSLLNLGQTSTL